MAPYIVKGVIFKQPIAVTLTERKANKISTRETNCTKEDTYYKKIGIKETIKTIIGIRRRRKALETLFE